MDIKRAKEIVREEFKNHGLIDWKLRFSSAKRQFGYCQYLTKTISLSKPLTKLNEEARVRNTILHEIAHALVGQGHGHDSIWEGQARAIGCDGERCTVKSGNIGLVQIEANYLGTCPKCKKVVARRFRLKGATNRYYHIDCFKTNEPKQFIVWSKVGEK